MASLTYSDIQTRAANRLRIPTSNSTEMTKIAALVNDVYRSIYAKAEWWWAIDRQIVNTADKITTGTVAVTNESTSLTFTTGPTPSVAGYKFIVSGNTTEDAVYRVATHTAAATTATLDAAYTGPTASAATFKLYKDTYDLASDTGTVLVVTRFGFERPLELIGMEQMQQIKAFDRREGPPHFAAVYNFATSGDPTTARSLVVHPFPDNNYRLEIHYRQTLNTELSSTTRPLIPDDWLNVLEYGVLADGYPIFVNDLERGAFYAAKFADQLNLMTARQREHEKPPQIVPRDTYRNFYRRGRRITPANADLGNAFGRYPYVP